jgi:hypothetical protein
MSVLRIQLFNTKPNMKIICEENKKTTLRIYIIYSIVFILIYEFRLIPVKQNNFTKRPTHTLLSTIEFYWSWLYTIERE